jgi:pimeloyl-ACP methyl ester carboxylesterase
VVLEAPAAGMSAAWGWVQPQIARSTRVCSYDRSGLGWSEAGDTSFVPAAVPEQLHALLTRAGEHPPYIFAGQGLGAALARLDAARFGEQVAALVLIDPPADLAVTTAPDGMTRLVVLSPWLARTGVLRATRMLSSNFAGLPEPAAGAFTAFLNRPDHLTRAALELSAWNDVVAESSAVMLRPDLPVLQVEAAGRDRIAFLTRQPEAAAAARTILDAVTAARRPRS